MTEVWLTRSAEYVTFARDVHEGGVTHTARNEEGVWYAPLDGTGQRYALVEFEQLEHLMIAAGWRLEANR